MRHLGMSAGLELEPVPAEAADKFVWLLSECDGFYSLDAQVGENVEEGQAIGRVTDFEGKVLQDLVAPLTGKVLFVTSSLAVLKGSPLLGIVP